MGLSRAEGSRLAEGDPQSRLGLDAEHGSGKATGGNSIAKSEAD